MHELQYGSGISTCTNYCSELGHTEVVISRDRRDMHDGLIACSLIIRIRQLWIVGQLAQQFARQPS